MARGRYNGLVAILCASYAMLLGTAHVVALPGASNCQGLAIAMVLAFAMGLAPAMGLAF